MRIEIFPLEKVVIDSTALYLGMKQTDAEKIVGKGQFVRDCYYYYNSELAISYDKDSNINFIEFLGGIDGQLKPIIYGVSAFDADADEVFELLKQHNGDSILDAERGYCYSFHNISIGVYRESTPQNVTEMINEAASFGNPMSNEDIEYETRKAHHWATFGFGVKNYYQQ